MNERLTLDTLRSVVDGSAVALRCVTEYQPAGGPGDKVFPPTYAGGQYAIEQRVIPASLLRDGERSEDASSPNGCEPSQTGRNLVIVRFPLGEQRVAPATSL